MHTDTVSLIFDAPENVFRIKCAGEYLFEIIDRMNNFKYFEFKVKLKYKHSIT